MDRTPLIEKSISGDMTATGYSIVRMDGFASQSPICGPTALTKLMVRKKDKPTSAGQRASPLYEPPRNCVGGSSSAAALSIFGTRSSYEEITDHYRSHDDTESSSGSDKSGDVMMSPVYTYPQFHPSNDEASPREKDDGQKGSINSMPRTTNRPRVSSWSSTLAAVTEETSFDEISKDASAELLPSEKPVVDLHHKTPSYETPPEKKEMLNAMRNLILKQQNALKELSEQNAQYRRKIGDYQTKLIEMKQEALNQQAHMEQLALEKDASAAECLWLREEMQALQQGNKTHLSDFMNENRSNRDNTEEIDCRDDVEDHAADEDKDDEDDSLQIKFKELMKPYLESPASNRHTCETNSSAASVTDKCGDHSWKNTAHTDTGSVAIGVAKDEADQEADANHESVTDENVWRPLQNDTSGTMTAVGQASVDSSKPSSCLSVSAKRAAEAKPVSTWGLSSRSREEVREEMAQFKKRLESIQKKRTERRAGIQQYNKPVVRFGVVKDV